jgi:hypothetical protein
LDGWDALDAVEGTTADATGYTTGSDTGEDQPWYDQDGEDQTKEDTQSKCRGIDDTLLPA